VCAAVLLLLMALRADSAPAALGLKLVADGFVAPLNLLPLDDGSGRLLIADQVGPIRVLNQDGKLAEQPFLDLRPKLAELKTGFDERGVLGVVLHPKFRQNRRLFIYYSAPRRASAPAKWNHTSRLSEFKVREGDAAQADPESERVLLEIDQPDFNHNGGRLAFGPDGFLYISMGDGGTANDTGEGHGPDGNGQDLSTLLGKILRIDVDRGEPYAVPADNPFADGKGGRAEIYAVGFRNPWSLAFDRPTGELFVADVGQNAYEEVNIVTKGGNYGWRLREGFQGFDPKNPNKPPEETPKTDAAGRAFVEPILAYKNFKAFPKDSEARGISITGGFVYRGKALPHLAGRYVFADWSKTWALPDGVLFAARAEGAGAGRKWSFEPLELASGKLGAYVLAFGQDAAGELYLLTSGRNSLSGTSGKVFKLVPL
jgi:glucose/arabinose dehydrogenase